MIKSSLEKINPDELKSKVLYLLTVKKVSCDQNINEI